MPISTSFLEIIELENGEVVLRRQDEPEPPLVRINFSEEAKLILNENTPDIGRVMIGAGLRAVGKLFDEANKQAEAEKEERRQEEVVPEGEIIH